ncbi:hypothetical protein [Hymenobacter volaticus]|uniref:Uncharacterized protein n=1 Tax=Hymenobacter volaticus TaxID=2932254 RepID=A0ABY4GF33_9BACT|nr:hypothetical protein [Hymenobacter volaticus]UOQ69546.1 hypothetical protein MUN86_28310 [Hymenobacter volaticus]
MLRATLDQLPAGPVDPPAPRGVWLASIMDGLDYLALLADTQGETRSSLELAQASLMSLQLLPCPDDPAQAEAWWSRVEAQHYRYSWHTLSPDQRSNKFIVWRYANYVCSVRLAAESFCEAAGEWYGHERASNQLWTATWHALEGLRQGLRLCYALGQQQDLTSDQDGRNQWLAIKLLLDHYLQAQRKLAAMIRRNQQPNRDMSLWVQAMLDAESTPWEQTQVGGDMFRAEAVREELYKTLPTKGYSLDTHKRLAELVASLTERVVDDTFNKARQEVDSLAYCREEDQVYQHVLENLLWQEYLQHLKALSTKEGEPVIPVPEQGLTKADERAYYETYLAAHPELVAPPEVLNLAPTLRSMIECRAEYEFLLEQPTLPTRTQALQQLLQEPVITHLAERAFTPEPAPAVGHYALYWRYEPFHQYPDPVGSWGLQLGLHLSRVCLNAARDQGFFFYDLDHNQYVLGHVALVRKQHGRWVLHNEE